MELTRVDIPQFQLNAVYEQQLSIAEFHKHLCARNTFPHPDQSPAIRALFADGRRIVQMQCGRSLGKTHNICYITWRFALTHPKSETYIICPTIKQAKKIYWLKRRIQDFGPRSFILEEWESKLQVIFKNGAYIVLDGCENYDALRGIKPDLVVYDEFQHHTKEFDEEVMQPNLSSGNVSLVVAGTPPKRHCYYVDFRKTVVDKVKAGSPRYYYVELPTEANPTIDKEWLAEKKADLFAKGKHNVWYREYEGKLKFDTESAIFPQFVKEHHLKPKEWIKKRIWKDRHKLDYYDIYDPGTSTCFAALFIAHNPYTSEVYVLDQIYEKERRECSSLKIWERATKIKEEWYDDLSRWRSHYDDAAAWFENEITNEYPDDEDVCLLPVGKQKEKSIVVTSEEGRPGESVIMNLMEPTGEGQLFFVNEELDSQEKDSGFAVDEMGGQKEGFVWELENYVTDENGRYPTVNDHLMDALFYFIYASHYTIKQQEDHEQEEKRELKQMRVESIREVVERQKREKDWFHDEQDDFYDTLEVGELWQ